MKMKKLLLSLFAAIFITGLMAQEIKMIKADKFTGDILAATTRETMGRKNSMRSPYVITYAVGGKKDNMDKIDYTLVVYATAASIFSIDEGHRVMFLLKDGRIITGNAPAYQIADRDNSRSFIEGTNNYTSCVEYVFDDFDWVSIENPITTVRVETNKADIEVDVKPDNQKKFVNCFHILKEALY